jgi:hypothetical protein
MSVSPELLQICYRSIDDWKINDGKTSGFPAIKGEYHSSAHPREGQNSVQVLDADPEHRQNVSSVNGIRWDKLDEDITVAGLLARARRFYAAPLKPLFYFNKFSQNHRL